MARKSKYAIIVAGGKGSRFNSELPKQFFPLRGKPILMYSIEAFHNCFPDINIILVISPEYNDYWYDLCVEHKFNIPVKIASSGDTRFQSVKNGLSLISDIKSLVAIHDGARPLISKKMIRDSFETAEHHGSAIPVIKMTDSIREITKDGSMAVDRNKLLAVQTPQTFDYEILKHSYDLPFKKFFTDDASVVEHAGYKIHIYEGEYQNIKITHPIDLMMAQFYLENE